MQACKSQWLDQNNMGDLLHNFMFVRKWMVGVLENVLVSKIFQRYILFFVGDTNDNAAIKYWWADKDWEIQLLMIKSLLVGTMMVYKSTTVNIQ